ncbi:MAG: M23 family metallopeptidase [Myxococcota bacterium]|nr:M23 family metallopeptidase [Myxococcota bacterium]
MTARAWGVILLLALAIVAGTAVWLRCEGVPPEVEAPEALAVGRDGVRVTVAARDPRSGVKRLAVRLRHAGGEAVLEEVERPGNPFTGAALRPAPPVEVEIDPKALGLEDGDAFLVVEAVDWSWADLLRGNRTVVEVPLRIDTRPPRLAVETGLTYLRRGGAGAVVYTLSEETARDGVQVGESFFAGHPHPDGGERRRVALFAVPRDAPEDPSIRVVAEDAAGNRGQAGWATRLRERSFDDVPIHLSEGFLRGKVMSLAMELDVEEEDPVAAFQVINREVRAANEARIREITRDSADEPLWDGAFLQMRNSAVTSRFAEHRRYLVDGRQVSEAIHYGYDLASTAGAPIEASNAGRVIFAGPLGIYGNTVVLDHGLGLFSLYGHLASIEVSEDDRVAKGGRLGVSGETGLAGGDHLHFAVMVGDHYVDPKEWWDPKWVREKIVSRLQPLE